MYGKIFDSMYDGTIAANWKALVTFQQMIVLCGADGVIDMTPPALSRRTGIPLEIIEEGIEVLANPDPYSRSQVEDGRRIVLIDENRPWGWIIVNHKHYRDLVSKSDKSKYDRGRYEARKGEKEDNSQKSTDSTHAHAKANNRMGRFLKPNVDQIKELMIEKGRSSDFANTQSIKFIDYYESCGWTIGKGKPMKSWSHAVNSWLDRAGPEVTRPSQHISELSL